MATELTRPAELASQKLSITPQLVLEIDGVTDVFGVLTVERYIRIGDTGLLIGNDWVVGGLTPVENQLACIDIAASSPKIQQQLEPDKGSVSSVSSVQISLIDFSAAVTELISPGFVVTDILARKAKLKLGFDGTGYPEDYLTIFSGVIDDVESGSGVVKLNIAHPEQNKRQKLFPKLETKLTSAINNAVTTIPVETTLGFRQPYLNTPSTVIDTTIQYCVRIDDEIIQYDSYDGTNFLTCTRGAWNTTATSHSDEASVESLYILDGSGIDLALKLMLSGVSDYWETGVAVESFVAVTGHDDVADSIFFADVDLNAEYGLVDGDWITTTGASNGANNVLMKQILAVEKVDGGTYITVDDVTFVRETVSSATASFRSQYDTLGYGLALTPDQVDVEQHVFLNELALASASSLRFFIDEAIDGKEFLDKEIYAPLGAYSIPRKGRCSVGYHMGPLPLNPVPIITKAKIKSPGKIKLRRSLTKNFYNTIIYKLDHDLFDDKFRAGFVFYDQDSRNRIDAGDRAFSFESRGLRSLLSAELITTRAANRLLNRYRFGAEFITGLEVFFSAGFNVEPGDLVVVDFTDLQVSNIQSGQRDKTSKMYEVVNRSLDLRTGDATLDLIDTNFDMTERYGVISPSSLIDSGATTTVFNIKESFEAYFPGDEGQKWEDYVGLPIRVHSEDYAFDETVTLSEINPADPTEFTVTPALSSPPSADYIVDVGEFPDTTDPTDSELYKFFHAFQSPAVDIVSAASDTVFTVGGGDIGKFRVGAVVIVRDADFSDLSPEVRISDITGNTLTVDASLGFTPSSAHTVEHIGFKDESAAYRFV